MAPRWPIRKILPLRSPWPPREHQPVLGAQQAEQLGELLGGRGRVVDRGHGVAAVGLGREEAEPGGLDPGPDHRPHLRVARPDVLDALLEDDPQALLHRVHHADRWGRVGLIALLELLLACEIEVPARQLGLLGGGEGVLRDRDHGQAGRRHPSLLRAADDHIQAEGVRLQRQAARAAHRVHRYQLAAALDHGRDRRHVVGDPGRGLVVGDEDLLDGRVLGQEPLDVLGVDGLALRHLEPDRVDAVGDRDIGPAVTERADRAEQRLLARAQQVGDGGLEPPRPARRVEEHVVARAQHLLDAGTDVGHQCRELGTPMVDHRPRLGAHHALWERGRTGYAKLLLEGHDTPRREGRALRGSVTTGVWPPEEPYATGAAG